MLFADRFEAGKLLARKLEQYRGNPDIVVLGLPRGGVPVAFEVARFLGAPLDIFVVRKLGVPGHEELAMGAIATGGVRVLNEDVISYLGIGEVTIASVAAQEQRELERREQQYRRGLEQLSVEDRIVILVDDGLATGASMKAAAIALKMLKAREIVIAVPVGAQTTCEALAPPADQVICLETPEPFQGVGLWYSNFSQTTDQEVEELLQRARGMEQ